MSIRHFVLDTSPGVPVTPLRAARDYGATWRQLHGSPSVLRAGYGVYTKRPAPGAPDTPARLAAFVNEWGRGAVVCGLTALDLLGVPLPRRLRGGPAEILVAKNGTRPQGRGFQAHRQGTGDDCWGMVHGVPVADPVLCWLQAARQATLEELVIMGDGLTRRQRPVTTIAAMAAAVEAARGARGIVKARAALAQIRPGTDSPKETATRLLLVRAGLPCPTVNLRVMTPDGPKYLDTAYEDAMLAVEYDGRLHDRPGQWEADLRRRRVLQGLDWEIITITGDDLWNDPESVVRSVAHALARRKPELVANVRPYIGKSMIRPLLS
jgi:very-short-patch-repair endonuclease